MTIREYLCREAQRITQGALSEFTDADAWRRLIPDKRRQFMEMMGLHELPPAAEREPVPVTTVDVLQRDGYRVEKLYYESLPRLYVAANLYIPDGLDSPAPAVLYVCGHSETQKVQYQAHPRKFAQLGFVSLIVETIDLGEVRGDHHGTYRRGWFHWYSRGYTPAGVELLNAIRALDLLQARPEVDGGRLGVTGISGGGACTWWTAAADERIQAAAPVCGTGTLASHIIDRTIDGHCDCMWWTNTYLWDLADVGALIAPRPLLIASADQDAIFSIDSVRTVHRQLSGLYQMLGAADNCVLVQTPGPHSYYPTSRTAIFSWFLKHLQHTEVPPEQVGDIDESDQAQESEETLRVFVNGPLPDDRSLTIQDELVSLAPPPQVADPDELQRVREQVVAELRAKTFRAFPDNPPALDTQITILLGSPGARGYRFAFTSEDGWRLMGKLTVSTGIPWPAPALVALRSHGEERYGAEGLASRVRGQWARIVVEPRGTGETAWGDALSWHIRRAAAWTGRTVASMQVWDVLRALEAVRSLEEVDPERVALAARGEMAAVALYAALLDGRISTLIVDSPPETQNAPSSPDGTGPAIEMLNCLRITDLAQVAGLLWPAQIVIAGECPDSFRWAQNLYKRLGTPDKFSVVGDLGSWQP